MTACPVTCVNKTTGSKQQAGGSPLSRARPVWVALNFLVLLASHPSDPDSLRFFLSSLNFNSQAFRRHDRPRSLSQLSQLSIPLGPSARQLPDPGPPPPDRLYTLSPLPTWPRVENFRGQELCEVQVRPQSPSPARPPELTSQPPDCERFDAIGRAPAASGALEGRRNASTLTIPPCSSCPPSAGRLAFGR